MSVDHVFVVLGYGQSPFLRGCLANLRDQSVKSRIVIATSTPSEFIDAAARAFGVDVVVNPARQGIGADFNFALEIADARYVTLAHQDDTYAPDFLAMTLAEFERHEGVLCFTSYQEVGDEAKPTSSKVSRVKHLIELVTLGRRRVVRGFPLRAFLSFGNPLPCSSVTFDRAKLPDFRFSTDHAANLDWDAWWRLREAGHVFLRAPVRLVGRRHNDLTATSRLIRDGTRRREDLAMFRRAWPAPLGDLIAFVYRAGY